MQNRSLMIYKITVSIIFKISTVRIPGCYGNEHLTEIFVLNSDFMIILTIMRIKNTVENVDWIFIKMADQLYLVKIVLIMHNKCSKADFEPWVAT